MRKLQKKMMNDDDNDELNEDHPLSTSAMYSIDDEDEDLFGRIPNENTLFADVDQALEDVDGESEDTTTGSSVPDASFYRPDGSSSMFYSTVYENQPPPPPDLPPPPPPVYNNETEVRFTRVLLDDPRLVHTSSLFSGPSYWTYGVTSSLEDKKVSVRRRFRHFVGLEDRIRKTCPGLILPPRPDKHLALSDEALNQTMSFAKARAKELQSYVNELLHHPLVPCTSYPSSPLYTFLTFPQDDLGIMWPEVSSSTLKRLSVSASRLTETVAQTTLNSNVIETDVEIRNLISKEQTRLSVISTSIPKILGYLTLLHEYGLYSGGTGMELSKLSKDVKSLDPQLAPFVELLSIALVLSSRRFKKQYHDLNATLTPFEAEMKYISSYQSAFNDRKHACMHVDSTRSKYLDKNNRILELQNSMVPSDMHRLAMLEQEIKMMDASNANAVKRADQIGVLIRKEVERLGEIRRSNWRKNLLALVKDMKQMCVDQVSIWENAKLKMASI